MTQRLSENLWSVSFPSPGWSRRYRHPCRRDHHNRDRGAGDHRAGNPHQLPTSSFAVVVVHAAPIHPPHTDIPHHLNSQNRKAPLLQDFSQNLTPYRPRTAPHIALTKHQACLSKTLYPSHQPPPRHPVPFQRLPSPGSSLARTMVARGFWYRGVRGRPDGRPSYPGSGRQAGGMETQ